MIYGDYFHNLFIDAYFMVQPFILMGSWCSMREMDIILYKTKAYIFHWYISL